MKQKCFSENDSKSIQRKKRTVLKNFIRICFKDHQYLHVIKLEIVKGFTYEIKNIVRF